MPGDPLASGTLLAERYRVGDRIGSGGMSYVHRGVDEALGRQVAIKALMGASEDPAEQLRVRSEIDLLATLSHRSLVTLFDAGTTEFNDHSITYLVMELVDGPTLGARAAEGPLPPQEIAAMARDLAEALVVVHSRGVVHRDIKPANVLLAPTVVPGREFEAKLADFGIAALVDGTRLTATGTVLGTAAYLSPEQATGARVSTASDIYSLGLVLLETITGHREYPGPLLESLTARQLRDPEVPGSIGYEWKSLLMAMTARDPEFRPTAVEVLARLAMPAAPLVLPTMHRAATGPTSAAAATEAAAPPALALTHAAHADADAPAVTAVLTADTDQAPARPRRRLLIGLVAAFALVLGAGLGLVLMLPGLAAPSPTQEPLVAELQSNAPEDPQTSTPPPTPTVAPAEVVAPAPAEGDGDSGIATVSTGTGTGAEDSSGNGSGRDSSSGNGSGPDSNSGNGSGPDSNSGNSGSGNGGSGGGNGGNGGGPGNGRP